MKVIFTNSDAFSNMQRLVNPKHTELHQLQQRNATHLPEFIEHYWEDEVLVVITKTHGLKSHVWNPFKDRYHDVDWVCFMQQIA